MTFPFTDPVLIFALAMVLFVAMPLIFERLRIPGIIGVIVAGAVVGPHGLNLLARGSTIVLLGEVGLLYLMFMVGLELDLNEFNRHRRHSVAFGVLSFILPQTVGAALSLALGFPLGASILLGAMFASHTLVAYPIASRLGIVKTGAVTTVLGATLLTDLFALLVLAVVAGAHEGGVGTALFVRLALALAGYVIIVMFGVPRTARWFFRRVQSDGGAEFIFTLALAFVLAYLAKVMGIEPIIGALLTGFALNRLVPDQSTLMNRLKFVADNLFVPFFLLSVGMLVDVRAFGEREAWVVIAALVAGTVASKAFAAKLTQRLFGFDAAEGWVMFGLSVSHAAATMAIVLVAFDLGIFDRTVVNAVVVIILVTCVLGPWMVQRFGRVVALEASQRPYEPSTAPQRILIPVANPATEEALLDLAIMLRGSDSEEPLYALQVVRDLAGNTEAEVAEAERMLSHAVIYAAGAEVPVVPLTRVDQNVASGIVRGVAETRSSVVVVGWDGRRSTVGAIFGSMLDQLLPQTRAAVVVARLTRPLNTTQRILLVVPPFAHRHPGFPGAAAAVKRLASSLGAPVHGLVLSAEPERTAELLRSLRPNVPTTFEPVAGWDALQGTLREKLLADDLVVVLAARRGTLAWSARLERLPGQLARHLSEDFLMVYPSEADTLSRADALPAELPRGLYPERIVRDLPSLPFEAALQRIVENGFPAPAARVERVVKLLVEGEQTFSSEVRPGVVVPHARVEGLHEPMVLLGTSPEGIEFPRARAAVKLVFVLLSPAERPEEHLRALAEIARMVSSEERVNELLEGPRLEEEEE